MSPPIETKKYSDDLAGAIYFAVGRGTEGGGASYHLAIAGITKGRPANETGTWGNQSLVAADSGYSIGAIQVDLGKRGTWPLGSTRSRPLNPGEETYVDAIINEASDYAKAHNLPFTTDERLLRKQLLSHGKGDDGLQFIDKGTKDSIDRWARSSEGQSWIHTHIDMPQIQELTKSAVGVLNQHGQHIREEDRFKVICMLAKTANQLPGLVNGIDSKKRGHITGLKETLAAGGDYADMEATVRIQKRHYPYLASDKAAQLGGYYESHLALPESAPGIRRAHDKVMSPTYSPAHEPRDPDIQQALDAFRHPASRHKRAELSPPLQQDYERIHATLHADGRWGGSEVDNISAALLREVAADDRVRQVHRVLVGNPAPLDGQVRVFAQYQPHGELGPHFTTHVVADAASRTPAEQSLAQVEEAARQNLQQQVLAMQQQQEQVNRSQMM